MQPQTGADNIHKGIRRPHFMEMDVLDRGPMHRRFSRRQSLKNCQTFVNYGGWEVSPLNQLSNITQGSDGGMGVGLSLRLCMAVVRVCVVRVGRVGVIP